MTRKIRIADKRSERTTFKLSESTIDGLKELASEYGVTFKEVFDTICSNNLEPLFNSPQEELIKKMRQIDQKKPERKTFVISRYSLNLLNRFQKECQVSRNLILEHLFSTYQADRSMKKRHLIKKHRRALKRIEKIIIFVEKELRGLDDFLDDSADHDAPIFDILNDVVLELIRYLKVQIENEIEHGTRIDIPSSIIKSMSNLY